jgi:hypothetical protein
LLNFPLFLDHEFTIIKKAQIPMPRLAQVKQDRA